MTTHLAWLRAWFRKTATSVRGMRYEFALVLAMLKVGNLVKELLGVSIYVMACYCHSFLFIPLGRHSDPLNDVLVDPLM